MSDPSNILDQFETYLTHCIIVAFPNTPDAEAAKIPLDRDLNMGDPLPGSSGIVVANDHRPSPTQIQQFNFEFCWRSIDPITSIMAGEITLADRNATGFMTFLKEKIVDVFEVSLENITFAMRIFWVTSETQNGERVISSEKFYFSVPDVRHSTKSKTNLYMLPVLALYNTKMQLPNLCNMYNMTITHKDGNLHEEIPTPIPGGGVITSRSVEDGAKYEHRRIRIDKSKPMETLKDVFEALEADLNASTKIHKLQLQKWQAEIRDDFNFKLGDPVKQTKELPIKYKIRLEDDYPSYKIDNRNLPFEQPEQRQASPGIRAIPTYPGENFYSLIDRIFSMSRKAGIDAKRFIRPKAVSTWQKVGDELHVDIVIKKHEIPNINSSGGENSLKFFYRTNSGPALEQNVDAYKILGKASRSDLLDITENNPATEDGRVSYGGDRENITAERMRDIGFFEAGYSGHRTFVGNNKVMGVEFPEALATYLKWGFSMQYLQDSDMVITIRGNPLLLSDLFRPPSKVASGDAGEHEYYARPELVPMYVKFRIFYSLPDDALDDSGNAVDSFEKELVDGEFYYEDQFMHLYKVESQMINGIFYQKLHMLRTDTLI